MGLGIGLGFLHQNPIILALIEISFIIENFKIRVANDGGTFEAESNLTSILTNLDNSVGLNTLSMVLTPNAFKTGKAYSVIGPTDFTVVRNTTATTTNSLRKIVLAAANVPRLTYLTSGGNPFLLVEPQKTNLLTYSEDYTDASWLKQLVNINTSVVAAPFAGKFGVKVTTTQTNAECNIRKTQAGNQLSHSIYGKKGELNYLVFRSSASGSFTNVAFNLNTGNIDQNGAPAFFTAKMENVGNGWYRCSVYIVSSSTSNLMLWIISDNPTTNNNAVVGSGLFLFGAQQEASIVPTSYIPTVASAVTRNADVITVAPPAGTLKITTTFSDNTTQELTAIPATYTVPQGVIKSILMSTEADKFIFQDSSDSIFQDGDNLIF